MIGKQKWKMMLLAFLAAVGFGCEGGNFTGWACI